MKASPSLLALALLGCASGASPAAPGASIVPTQPLIVAGQSNALRLAPALQAAVSVEVRAESVQNGAAISNWSLETRPQVLWPLLSAELHPQVQAVVWWQGESDRDNPQYAAELRDLLMRIREDAGWTVPILLVRVLPRPENAAVRAAQEAVAAELSQVRLVSCDDLPSDGGDHLQPTGYVTMAQRILTVLP